MGASAAITNLKHGRNIMDMIFKRFQISEDGKECYKPKQKKMTPFEGWAMCMAYCQLYDQFGPNAVSDRKIMGCIVWNGNELYNTEYQATKDGGEVRLWMNTNDDLMMEVFYSDDRPNKLFLIY